MGNMSSLVRELRFAIRDKIVLFSLISIALLSSFSLLTGLQESASEHSMIERTKNLVAQDRDYYLAKQTDPGGAAYYAFHFTYDPPSSLAFISRGVRDELPWKHRLRMLALEGQIYESDAGNPELSKIGKLDFAFVAAFLLPLLSILLLYDLRASELRDNRWAYLSVTVGNGNRLLLIRAALRSLLLFIALIMPFVFIAIPNNVGFYELLLVIIAAFLNCVFWFLLAYIVFTRVDSGPTTAAILLACWFLLTVAIPVGGKYLIEQAIATPIGGEMLLTQREAVNDAWDLPKEATMMPFLERHPEWVNTPKIEKPFEWKWYYAFQQVGDQTVESLTESLRSAIANRDKAMGTVSILSPPLLTHRLLSQVANTDVSALQRYDQCVRAFHQSLREFHYPMLFGDVEYSSEQMTELPIFEPCIE